ncbi:MAG TPA: UDP-N-acetylmuramoyl-tripeptide--D-alanyl-D-alanine ligase [Actinomycetota bacterium]|nr:UDP-N-acetylmuramoyl-tripeptide--D-alanyl-D-alanine ligase [Actinomycetota bacterium]
MRPRTLRWVAEATGGRLGGADAEVRGATSDSRQVRPGDLFVAIRGERTDGHDHVDAAFAAGAAGALVSDREGFTGPVVVVEDTGAALLSLGAAHRRTMDAEVVGITGSAGKTSVKDLTAAVLAARFRTASSPKSFNTDVGVPLTLLNAPDDAEVVVCEMGSRGRGHIARLCEVARPRVGAVTNVGLAHLEMFGSPEAVADAKAELVESLPTDGVAILNADDPVVTRFGERTTASVLRFGRSVEADVRATDLSLDRLGRPSFTLMTPDGAERVELAVVGEHMASNALAASAVGVALGLSAGECAAALKEARVSRWRMEVRETPSGVVVVNDAYNANPASMAAALKSARWMAGEGRSIAVLGEMAELGAASRDEHERVGELVARLGIDRLIVVGAAARPIAVGAAREGVEPERITTCDTIDEAEAAVSSVAGRGDVVLVKGSRVVGLEHLAEALT